MTGARGSSAAVTPRPRRRLARGAAAAGRSVRTEAGRGAGGAGSDAARRIPLRESRRQMLVQSTAFSNASAAR